MRLQTLPINFLVIFLLVTLLKAKDTFPKFKQKSSTLHSSHVSGYPLSFNYTKDSNVPHGTFAQIEGSNQYGINLFVGVADCIECTGYASLQATNCSSFYTENGEEGFECLSNVTLDLSGCIFIEETDEGTLYICSDMEIDADFPVPLEEDPATCSVCNGSVIISAFDCVNNENRVGGGLFKCNGIGVVSIDECTTILWDDKYCAYSMTGEAWSVVNILCEEIPRISYYYVPGYGLRSVTSWDYVCQNNNEEEMNLWE